MKHSSNDFAGEEGKIIRDGLGSFVFHWRLNVYNV